MRGDSGMAKKKYLWNDTREYQRIIEILEDYWVTQPREDKVIVDMKFKRGNEYQKKTVVWENPNTQKESDLTPQMGFGLCARVCCRCKKRKSGFQTIYPDEWDEINICNDCIEQMNGLIKK